jgi:hypothetical protein
MYGPRTSTNERATMDDDERDSGGERDKQPVSLKALIAFLVNLDDHEASYKDCAEISRAILAQFAVLER